MKVVYFTHSLASCWNHGNAHVLRGVLRELVSRGHVVVAAEPVDGWSVRNLRADHGEAGVAASLAPYPELRPHAYAGEADLDALLDGADLVIAHEWNEPWLVAALGRRRRGAARWALFFHDTHHRAVSDPDAIRRFDLGAYDGVLAFGAALADVYRRWGWGERVHVWHEAADTRLFRPPATPVPSREDVVWIGNWGDDERGAELTEFLLRPAQATRLPLDVYGVRFPAAARAAFASHGARQHGWLPNARVPDIFARHLATVHVPRRFYVQALPGIPTIRVFEALACGIPLVCSPWHDVEGLFHPGLDYLVARDAAAMTRHLRALRDDADLRASLTAHGLDTIAARHTCAHRVDELLGIVAATARTREVAA